VHVCMYVCMYMHASVYLHIVTYYNFNILGRDAFKYTVSECKPNFVCKYEA